MLKPGLIGLATLLLAAAAPLSQGDPVQNRVVAITWCCIGHAGDDAEEDEGVPLTVSGTTDRSGSVLLSAQPGRYALKLPNAQTLRVPAVARIEVGRTILTTSTIQPGGRGDAYFMGRDGRRLSFMVPRGARVRVVLTEGAPAGGGASAGGSTRIGIPGPPIVTEDGDIITGTVELLQTNGGQGDTGTNPDGRAGARVDRRIPPPAPRAGADVAVGDINGDGRADARTDPRIPPPTPRTTGMEP